MTGIYSAPTGLTGDIPDESDPLTGALTWEQSLEPGTTPVLLLHFDGTNGQLTTVDSSPYEWGVTMPGFTGLELTTSAPKFGTASLALPTTNPAIPPNNNLVTVPIGSGGPLDIFSLPAWTIQCWWKVTSNTNDGFAHPFTWGDTTSAQGAYQKALCVQMVNLNSAPQIQMVNSSAFVPAGGTVAGSITVALDTWYHIAVVSSGGMVTLYFDGNMVDHPAAWSASEYTTGPNLLADIGMFSGYSGGDETTQIDEFAVYPSALWSGTSFTPPTQPFSGTGTVAPGYDVYRDGVSIATFTGGPSYTDTVPAVGTYVYTVAAWDGSADASDLSAPFSLDYQAGVVPNLVNTSLTTVAPELLSAVGLVVGVVTYATSALIIAGNIISQDPAAGTVLTLGAGVNVVVSTGLNSVRVPLVLFEDQATAVTQITNLGLAVGSINFVSSSIFAAGEIMGQNPAAGTIVASGSLVSFTISLGESIPSAVFDYEPTVISQYANSPSMLQWLDNCNQYFDQSANVAAFISVIWNIDTAIGFGLDILGAIVGVSRLLRIPNAATYFGFANTHSVDWDNFGSKNPGGAGTAPFYTGFNSTEAYLLNDNPYRQLILAKAFANICKTTCPAMNQILQNLYGAGAAYVLNTGPMAISYNFTFIPSAIQLAILQQSGVIPTPPGVAVTIVTP